MHSPLKLRSFGLYIVLFLLLGCGVEAVKEGDQSDSSDTADIIFFNGEVYTVDINRSWAQAVAVRGSKIIYVGNDSDVMKFKGKGTRLVDLENRMLMPGFQDSHVHPIEAGMAYIGCSLHDGKSIEDYMKIVADCAKLSEGASFIDGGGWTMDTFKNGLPDKKILDSVVPDKPVILKSATGHQLWVNSKMLEMAEISSSTVDPARGRIDRYPGTNEPSGTVQENSAMNLVFDKRPDYSKTQMRAALDYGQKYLNQFGVTSVQDALLKLDGKEAYVGGPTYLEADQSGSLTLRVIGALVWNTDLGMEQIERIIKSREKFSSPRFTATSVKIWLDGVLEVHTAALLEPYLDREDKYKGELLITPELLDEIVLKLDSMGFQLHFHAIGDAAIRQSLDSLENAAKINGVRDSRHHLSHIELFNPDDVGRLRDLNVVANFQPYWAWADQFITELTMPKLGPERSKWLYPIGSILKTGAVVAFGSDWFVTSGNPMLGIETAITRKDPLTNQSDDFLMHERINLADAIAAYTINGAYVNFMENDAGSVEVDKYADLIVIDRNLFKIPETEISEANVVLTLLDGELVYGDWDMKLLKKTAL